MVPASQAAPQSSGSSYKVGDNCKRHRLPDNAPKSVRVRTYVRRKKV